MTERELANCHGVNEPTRDTPPGAKRGGCVHSCGLALERANFVAHDGASLGVCPLQGCPGFGVSLLPGANLRCCDLEVAPLSFGFCPGGPVVRGSARLYAKLECAGETDLPHAVSDNFSKPGKLLEAGRPPAVSPCARVGAKFCEPELQNALVHMHGDPLRRRLGRGGARAVRPAQRAELGGARAVQAV